MGDSGIGKEIYREAKGKGNQHIGSREQAEDCGKKRIFLFVGAAARAVWHGNLFLQTEDQKQQDHPFAKNEAGRAECGKRPAFLYCQP
ncbi:hypothetical protein D3C72_786410 [compost metagenome]